MAGVEKQGTEACRDLRIIRAHELYVVAMLDGCVALANKGGGNPDHDDRSLALGLRKMRGCRIRR